MALAMPAERADPIALDIGPSRPPPAAFSPEAGHRWRDRGGDRLDGVFPLCLSTLGEPDHFAVGPKVACVPGVLRVRAPIQVPIFACFREKVACLLGR